LEGLAQEFFAAALSVDVGSIEIVHAAIQGEFQRAYGFFVILALYGSGELSAAEAELGDT